MLLSHHFSSRNGSPMSKHRLGTSLGLIAIGAVLAGTGTAAAATGGPFVLGRDNTASTPTILRNSSTGANLTLPAARAGQPPLAVSSSSGRVNFFNSDKLDGLDSSSFALAGGRVGSVEAFGKPVEVVTPDGTPETVYVAYAACPAGTKLTGGGHETWTQTGEWMSRAASKDWADVLELPGTNGWMVVTSPDEGTVAADFADAAAAGVVAVAHCYNPRGAVTGAVESFDAGDESPSEDERARLLELVAQR